MMAFSFLWLLFSSPDASAGLRFQYVPHEGGTVLQCRHKPVRDLPDYDVYCEGAGLEKKFQAHVVIREIGAAKDLEILYWVTERAEGKRPVFHSTSALLRGKGEASRISLSQGVENDYASLVLDWSAE